MGFLVLSTGGAAVCTVPKIFKMAYETRDICGYRRSWHCLPPTKNQCCTCTTYIDSAAAVANTDVGLPRCGSRQKKGPFEEFEDLRQVGTFMSQRSSRLENSQICARP